MSKKRLLINLFANIISYGTTLIISLVLTPYLIKVLGNEVYGFYPLANNFVNYMSIITVALNSMASRFITIEIVKGNIKKANIYFSSIFFSNIILSAILLLPMIVIVIFLDKILQIPINLISSVKILFSLVFISMIINIITSVFGTATFAKNRIDMRSGMEIFQSILRVILFLLLFSIFTPSIIFVGLVAMILSISSFIIQVRFTNVLLPEVKILKKYYNFKAIIEILASGVWNSINQLSNILLNGLSLLIANISLGAVATSIFSVAQTVPNFIGGILGILIGVFVPQMTYKYAQNNIEGLIIEVKESSKLLGLIINVPMALFIGWGKEFYSLWVPSMDSHLLQVLSVVLMMNSLINGTTATVTNIFTVCNKLKARTFVTFLLGILNIILVPILLKTTNLGLFAIPFVNSVLGTVVNSTFTIIYASKCINAKWHTFYPSIFKNVISTLIIYVSIIVLRSFLEVNSWFKLILACGLSGIFAMVINILIIFKPSELRKILLIIKNRII